MRSAHALMRGMRLAPRRARACGTRPRRARRRTRCRPCSGCAAAEVRLASPAPSRAPRCPAFTLSSWRAIHAGSWRAASRLRSRNDGDAGVGDAVAQRLVAAHAARARRDPPGCSSPPRDRVEVLADHARVVDRLAVVHHQRGHLVERVVARHRGVGGPRALLDELERQRSSRRGSRAPCARRERSSSRRASWRPFVRCASAKRRSIARVVKFALSRCPPPSPPSRPSTGATPPRPGRCRSTSASSRSSASASPSRSRGCWRSPTSPRSTR